MPVSDALWPVVGCHRQRDPMVLLLMATSCAGRADAETPAAIARGGDGDRACAGATADDVARDGADVRSARFQHESGPHR